ncbi:MAG: dihydroorotase family protein [Oligoflexales bacterium]
MLIIKNARLEGGGFVSLYIENGHFTSVIPQEALIPCKSQAKNLKQLAEHGPGEDFSGEVDAGGSILVPGGIDVHVHSRDPGYTHKEDWQTLGQSAFKGGVVGLIDMPNTFPPMMGKDEVLEKAEIAKKSGLDYQFLLGVGQDNIGKIKGLLTDSSLPLAGIKVYYGQSTGNLMFSDLELLSKSLPSDCQGCLVFHSEDQCRIDERSSNLHMDSEHDTTPASYRIHSEIRDSRSAWISTKQIIAWSIKNRRPFHLAHVSTPLEIELVQEAKNLGVPISTEVSPHHLLITSDDYAEKGAFIKVNPPVRSKEEVAKLRTYMAKGMIDCFATDHAPHTKEEKAKSYGQCPSGIPAIEFYWPLLYKAAWVCDTPVNKLLAMACSKPAHLFGFKNAGKIEPGYAAHFVWIEPGDYVLKETDIEAKCDWSPYLGTKMKAKVIATWKNGKCVYHCRN